MSERPDKAPPFDNLVAEDNGSASVWINESMLDAVSDALRKGFDLRHPHSKPILDFAIACIQNEPSFNSECASLVPTVRNGFKGCQISFNNEILRSVGYALTQTDNKAVAKVGYEFMNIASGRPITLNPSKNGNGEFKWRGKGFFACGINIDEKIATFSFNRNTLSILNRQCQGDLADAFASAIEEIDYDYEDDNVDVEETEEKIVSTEYDEVEAIS